jgi:hypothetical protein
MAYFAKTRSSYKQQDSRQDECGKSQSRRERDAANGFAVLTGEQRSWFVQEKLADRH